MIYVVALLGLGIIVGLSFFYFLNRDAENEGDEEWLEDIRNLYKERERQREAFLKEME